MALSPTSPLSERAPRQTTKHELFIVGPRLEVPRLHVTLSVPYEYGALCGVLEERLGLKVGAVQDVRIYDIEHDLWEDARDRAPKEKAKLWVRIADAPPMLCKEVLGSGTREYQDCRRHLDAYLKPFTASTPNARVSLCKVEQLHNAEHEHYYQTRRRELHDPENVWRVRVGGAKATLKSIAEHGFQLPKGGSLFGAGALVFGSDVRSAGEDGLPSPASTNKLLLCEAALGLPKVIPAPSPSHTLRSLHDEGFDSIVQPADEAGGVEYVALYHHQQVIPRFMVTYSLEYVDPELLCAVTGEELVLVEKGTGRLECMRCAVRGKSEAEYEPVEDVAAREKARFMSQQDELSGFLLKLKKEFVELAALRETADKAHEALVDRISSSVTTILERVRRGGSALIDHVRAEHLTVRDAVDQHAVQLHMAEARAFEVHQLLSDALAASSDACFHKGLQRFREIEAGLTLPEAVCKAQPRVDQALGFLQRAAVDITPLLQQCDSLRLTDPLNGNVRLTDPLNGNERGRTPRDVAVDTLRSDAVAHGEAALLGVQASDLLPAPPSEPTEPPSCPSPVVHGLVRTHESSWDPPQATLDPSTVLSLDEAHNSPKVRWVLLGFGSNDTGQLGLGGGCSCVDTGLVEVQLSPNANVSRLASGARHTLCAASDGRIYAFGSNTRGQLGLGHKTALTSPTPLYSLGGSEAVDLACGDEHSLVLTRDQVVYAFGRNGEGQLGLGHVDDQNTPWVVPALCGKDVTCVAAGAYHSACIAGHGREVYTWGSNREHQLGIGSAAAITTATVPQRVDVPLPGDARVAALTAGGFHNLVLLDNRTQLFVWGKNDGGQLGLGHEAVSASPRLVAALADAADPIEKVFAGRHGSAVVTRSGQLLLWGEGRLFPGVMPSVARHFSSASVPEVAIGKEHFLLEADGQVFHVGVWPGQHNTSSTPRPLPLPQVISKYRHRVVLLYAAGGHSFVVAAVAGGGPLYRPMK